MSHFKAKMHQIRFLVSVRLAVRWSLTLLQLIHAALSSGAQMKTS